MITKFKKFQEDKDLEDFEEDVIADYPKEDDSKKEIKEEKMRTFKQHITEDGKMVGTATSNAVEDGKLGAHNIHDPEVLNRVNAFVGSIGDMEYIKPQQAVDSLREKLNRVHSGLSQSWTCTPRPTPGRSPGAVPGRLLRSMCARCRTSLWFPARRTRPCSVWPPCVLQRHGS